jgi:hypothetical protein
MARLSDRFDPNVERLSILPRPANSLPAEGRGSVFGKPIDYTDIIAPQLLVDLVKAFETPYRALQGEEISPQEALNVATNVAGGGFAASGSAPAAALGAFKRGSNVGGVPIRELLYPGRGDLTSAEKAAVTRFEKSLANRAVRQREEMRLAGSDIITPTPRLVKIQEIGINPASLLNKTLVPVAGDLSMTGGNVSQIAGIPLSQVVKRQGGREFMLLEPNVKQNVAWASEPAAASSKTENLRMFADKGEDALGIFLGMSPQGINFSHHMAQGMVGQLPTLPITKQAYKELREDVRKTWIKDPETGVKRYPFKDFAGVDSPNINELMSKDGQLRKAIVESMSKAKFRDQGFPRWEDTAKVMNDPRLFQGEAGRSMFIAQPGAGPLVPKFQHGSYSMGIPGQYYGGLQAKSGEIVGAPADLLFPKTYERMRKAGKTEANIARSMQVAHHGEKFTQETLDPLMKYLGF